MSWEERKAAGNELIKEGHFQQAAEAYSEAIALAADMTGKQMAILYSNRSQAQLKLENYGLVIADAGASLAHDATFAKSWYRRAVAKYALRDLEGALDDLKSVKKLVSNDPKINALDKEIRLELKTMRFEMAIDIVEKSVFTTIDWKSFPHVKAAEVEDPDAAEAELKNGTYLGKVMGSRLEVEVSDEKEGDVIVRGLDRQFIDDMVVKFKRGWKLSHHDAFAIVAGANTIFKKDASLVDIGMKSSLKGYLGDEVKKITVCGDTHGQFYDVLNIFEKFGDVNNEHAYLFNGDFVDRGSWSCEVALLLYALKVLYPNRIFVNRGNHETNDMNSVYGFEDECKKKYNDKLFRCFSQSFQSLPYCTVIGGEYIVMHGGLFSEEHVKLDDIRKINRFKHKQPPKEGLEMEMLWTDPQTEEGYSPSKRGVGLQFGPDVTKKFLDDNNLKCIIRSHEVRQNGYEYEHDGRLITVFSAPNYCDAQGNLGAVINFQMDGEEMTVEPSNFEAVWHPNIPPMNYTKNQFGF